MKIKLFSLAALVLLSAISSIFNTMPIIGVSAQDYETVDDSISTQDYEIVDDSSDYNTDTGYNNFDPSLGEQNVEYSSYDDYGPPNPDYGNGNEEYSSYDNYEYPSNGDSMDDSYYTNEDPGLYGNQYDNNYYAEDSYDSNYYPPKKAQKFTCPDSGLVVDKPESCPVICPIGTTLEGHFVAAESNLTKICNIDQQVLEKCPAGTDLQGVFVENAPEQCNIFDTCDANTPLGQALGLNATEGDTVEVADAQLCLLEIPQTQIFICPSTAIPGVVDFPNPAMAGQNVTSLRLCEAATPAVQCPATSANLAGVWVNPNNIATCNLVIPPPQPTVTTFVCPAGYPTSTNMTGAIVTDIRLCQSPTVPNICPAGTDLAGVFANITATDLTACDLTFPPPPSPGPAFITNNTEAQCLKCADLAIGRSGNFPAFSAEALRLIGTTAANIFAACDEANPRPAFNALSNESAAETAFDTCLDNAGVKPGNSTSGPRVQGFALSLQENSLTTNVQPEAEIPMFSESISPLDNSLTTNVQPEDEKPTFSNQAQASALQAQESTLQAQASALQGNSITTNAKPQDEISTFSPPTTPPTIAQGTEDSAASSSALEKMTKLKQQWLDLLP